MLSILIDAYLQSKTIDAVENKKSDRTKKIGSVLDITVKAYLMMIIILLLTIIISGGAALYLLNSDDPGAHYENDNSIKITKTFDY